MPIACDIERPIVRRTVRALLNAGFNLGVFDEEEHRLKDCGKESQVMQELGACDFEYLTVYRAGKRVGWVMLVFGNDEDIVADYTMNLDEVLQPTFT